MTESKRTLHRFAIAITLIGLTLLCTLVCFWLWENRVPKIYRDAAFATSLDASKLYEASQLAERARRTHKLKTEDWNLANRLFAESSPILVGNAIRAMAEVSDPTEQPLATQKIESLIKHPEFGDSYDLLYSLRKVGSRKWRAYAQSLVQRNSPSNREVAQNFLERGDYSAKN